jgi:hypothetical protein
MILLIKKIFFILYFGIISMWSPPSQEGRCDNWEATMIMHGLDPEVFSPIMWRESRCETWQVNEDDPNGGSFGLLQINAIHLEDVQLHPDKWVGVERCQVTTTGDLLIGWRNICFATHLVERAGTDPWGL